MYVGLYDTLDENLSIDLRHVEAIGCPTTRPSQVVHILDNQYSVYLKD